MFITVRKPALRREIMTEPAPVLLGARPSGDGYSRNVPRRGRQAAVSLWIAGLPEDCSLTDLEVSFSGTSIIPCHITLGVDGVRQVNALLPRNFQVGPVMIGIAYRGRALAQTFELEVIEGDPQRPVIVSASDGENLALQRKTCRGLVKLFQGRRANCLGPRHSRLRSSARRRSCDRAISVLAPVTGFRRGRRPPPPHLRGWRSPRRSY